MYFRYSINLYENRDTYFFFPLVPVGMQILKDKKSLNVGKYKKMSVSQTKFGCIVP